MGAEGDAARGFADGDAGDGLKPLAVSVNEGDSADGRAADGCGQAHKLVVLGLLGGVENVEAVESREAGLLAVLLRRTEGSRGHF